LGKTFIKGGKMADAVVNGIWLEKGVTILDSEKLWQQFQTRLVYVDMSGNSSLLNVANTCAYQGFAWGGFHRMRYPPEIGSADSQAFEFAAAVLKEQYGCLPTLPPVLELRRGVPVFCETNQYRGMVETLIKNFKTYAGKKVIIRATKEVIKWLTPSSTILACDLWIHEPTTQLDYRPWTNYAFRSFAPRDMLGTMAAPFYFPHDKNQMAIYLKNGTLSALPVSLSSSSTTTPTATDTSTTTMPTTTLTDAQKLAKLKELVNQMAELLK
jgi:hypothetical protein